MAGLLQTRSRHTLAEVYIIAGIRGQKHECQCGEMSPALPAEHPEHVAPKCPECGVAMFPMWTIRDLRGRIRGEVAGGSMSAALESAKQSILTCKLKAYSVAPAVYS